MNNMTITFISNYMTHHQLPFCIEMYKLLGDNFAFVETNNMEDERKQMGWAQEFNKYPFVYNYDRDNCEKLIFETDLVICGGTHEIYIRNRMDHGKITFRYFERLYKTGKVKAFIPTSYIRKYKEHTLRQDKPVYLLCAGAYVASDFNIFGAYKNKAFKWGYFTELTLKSFENIFNRRKINKKVEILWTGRMLDWKHPESSVKAVRKLLSSKKQLPEFHLTMIGEGMKREWLMKYISDYGLEKYVDIKDFMSNSEIREYMEKSDIYLMTSDYNEGWGAVVNEAMDKGMLVIGSWEAGAVPYLIKDNQNGLVYKYQNINQLAEKLELAITDADLRYRFGKEAYNTIHDLWNAKVAAERFVHLSCNIFNDKNIEFYDRGPLSMAEVKVNFQGKSR